MAQLVGLRANSFPCLSLSLFDVQTRDTDHLLSLSLSISLIFYLENIWFFYLLRKRKNFFFSNVFWLYSCPDLTGKVLGLLFLLCFFHCLFPMFYSVLIMIQPRRDSFLWQRKRKTFFFLFCFSPENLEEEVFVVDFCIFFLKKFLRSSVSFLSTFFFFTSLKTLFFVLFFVGLCFFVKICVPLVFGRSLEATTIEYCLEETKKKKTKRVTTHFTSVS